MYFGYFVSNFLMYVFINNAINSQHTFMFLVEVLCLTRGEFFLVWPNKVESVVKNDLTDFLEEEPLLHYDQGKFN